MRFVRARGIGASRARCVAVRSRASSTAIRDSRRARVCVASRARVPRQQNKNSARYTYEIDPDAFTLFGVANQALLLTLESMLRLRDRGEEEGKLGKKDWVASHVADSGVRTSANLGLAAFSDAVAGLLWVNI